MPTAIDLERYRDLPAPPAHEGLTVGWIGIPLNAHYLSIVAPALRARAVRVKLHVVGAPVPAELAGIPAESFAWTEDSEIARIAAFDVGIMPLHDTPWERGKCAYKLLQVMAAGKPVIASPVGANRQVVQHGVNGFLAETTEEWAEALRQLADPGAAPPHGRGGAQDRGRAVRDRGRRAAPCRDPERGGGCVMRR